MKVWVETPMSKTPKEGYYTVIKKSGQSRYVSYLENYGWNLPSGHKFTHYLVPLEKKKKSITPPA